MCIYEAASRDNKQIWISSVNLLSQMYQQQIDLFDWVQTRLTKTSVDVSPEAAGDSFFTV